MLFIFSTQRVVISQRGCELLDWCITTTIIDCNNSWRQAAKHHAVAKRHKIAHNSQRPVIGGQTNRTDDGKTFPSLAHSTYNIQFQEKKRFQIQKVSNHITESLSLPVFSKSTNRLKKKVVNFVARESRANQMYTRKELTEIWKKINVAKKKRRNDKGALS